MQDLATGSSSAADQHCLHAGTIEMGWFVMLRLTNQHEYDNRGRQENCGRGSPLLGWVLGYELILWARLH